ncbi:JERKL protein, partial [Pseudoatta argentina]
MAPKRKKVCIPLETKLRALKRIDRGECHKKVAAKFGVGRVTVGDWIRNRAKLMAWKEKTKSSNERKAMKFTEHTKVEEALFLWFVQQREKGAPISGSILQAKALSLYSHFPDEAEKEECFVASNGWLDRWKKRYGIRLMQFNTRGEKFFEDDDVVNIFKEKFKKTIKRGGYSLEQIYNCDEITLKNLTTSTMPVYYKNQKNVWMDTTIFKWWFHKQFVPKVEKHLTKMKLPRKAILFIDNAPAHPNAAMLYDGDIIVKFFPTNVQASLIQPMEQGVFEHLKRLYRFHLLTFLLEASESGQKLTDSLEKVNLKKVVFWVAQSWKEIKSEILKKSWNKLFNFSEKEKDLENIELPKQKEELRNKLFEMAKSLLGPEQVMETNIEEWITGDDRELDYTDAEIVALVEQKSSEESSSESDEEVVEPIERKISHSDAVSALKIVLAYVEQEEATLPDVCTLKKWRDIAAKNRSAALRETKRSK